jgi:hypothetical protein
LRTLYQWIISAYFSFQSGTITLNAFQVTLDGAGLVIIISSSHLIAHAPRAAITAKLGQRRGKPRHFIVPKGRSMVGV